MNNEVRVSKLTPDGIVEEVGSLNPLNCPQLIMVLEHYRNDGSCKCNDKNEIVMKEWGYRWDEKLGRWK